MRGVLREPLLHFALLGAGVFLLYRALHPVQDEQHVIRLDDAKRTELMVAFEQRFGRRPLASELSQMVAQWVQGELLFREGIALQLDKNDPTMREMVISRSRASIQGRLSVPAPSEAQLEAFYEAHREDYDEPARVSFEQYLVSTSELEGEEAARALQQRAERGEPIDRTLSAPEGRTSQQVELLFGADFARRLFALEDERWHVLRSPRGYHVVRITAREAAKAVPLAAVRQRVAQDYTNAAKKERYHATLEQLLTRYEVEVVEEAR